MTTNQPVGGGGTNSGVAANVDFSDYTYKSSATSFEAMGVGFGGKGSCGWSEQELVQMKGTNRFVALVGGGRDVSKQGQLWASHSGSPWAPSATAV